ncbi:NUDIX hydrolase domain-like protein [Schizophyllum commune]
MHTPKPKAPAEPHPSASIAVINARNEVLLVQRNPKTRSFAGVHVFPGGNLDPAQDGNSLAMTAIREAFEESGLLLATPSTSTPLCPPYNSTFPPPSTLEAARRAIHAQRTNFSEFLAKEGLRADVDTLLPSTEWVTPVEQPRRFRTKFFLACLPSASSAGFTAGDKQEQIPTPDGGQEVISARFVRPADALAEFEAGRISFMPPQFYILTTLAGIFGEGDAQAVDARSKIERLARGPFGRMVINPRRLDANDASYPKSSVEEGETVLTYEGDEARGGPRGRRHRAVVRFAKGGITTRIRLERNFDIFEGMDGAPSSSKL